MANRRAALPRLSLMIPRYQLPMGIKEAAKQVAAHEQRMTWAAQYVCALAVWHSGCGISPRARRSPLGALVALWGQNEFSNTSSKYRT